MMERRDPLDRAHAARWGGSLEGIELFDAGFFGISPREADLMDPQQRLLLEVAYEALQDAGQPASALAGSETGVFVAQHGSDYAELQRDAAHDRALHAWTGVLRGITSGRLSHAFDLRGPSVTVDTTCSSSLAALHLAVRSIQSGDCERAIVGGVNVVLLPELRRAFAMAGLAAPDGRCKFGDPHADGFVRSDGVAAIVLRPLSAALDAHDRVHAVVRGSALSNDGRAAEHLMTPAADGQEHALRGALADAGVCPADVDYVEAHGTGTAVGDGVELGVLDRVLSEGRPADRPCVVGSAKSMFGHAESAAGLVGVIRAALCLRYGMVPPDPLRGPAVPVLDRPGTAVTLARESTSLPRRGRAALAGVSSFGLSGTNGHVVLEAPPLTPGDLPEAAADDRDVLLVASARTGAALDAVAAALRDRVAGTWDLPGLARAMVSRRDHHAERLAVVAGSERDVMTQLEELAAGLPGSAIRGRAVEDARPRVVFVFSGHGAQWRGMGRALLASDPAFATAVLRCDEAVRAEAGWSVLEHLATARYDDSSDVEHAQPLTWAVQVAIAEALRARGIEPDAVVGHSSGEVAAAYVAGALSLADAAAVICRRVRVAARLRGQGGMLLTGLTREEAAVLVAPADLVAVAACNGPRATVLSGDRAELGRIAAELAARDVPARPIDVEFASHSPQVEPLIGELRGLLANLRPRPGRVPVQSTVLGEAVDGSGMDGDYWAAHLRRPVLLDDAVRAQLAASGERGTVLVEIAPHPVLFPALHQLAAEVGAGGGGRASVVATLRRDEPETRALLTAIGHLYVAGVPLGAGAVAGPGPVRHVDLPRYPWQHTAHWLAEPAPGPALLRSAAPSAVPVAAASVLTTEPDPAPFPVLALPLAAAAVHPAHAGAAGPGNRGPGEAGPVGELRPPAPVPARRIRPDGDVAGLERLVREQVATVLHIPPDEVPGDRPLGRIGLDSLLGAELTTRIYRAAGVRVPGRAVAGGAVTVRELAETVRALNPDDGSLGRAG